MNKAVILKCLILILLFPVMADNSVEDEFSGRTIVLRTGDDLVIKADLYVSHDESAPVILLFHQAGFSRGEYRETAPKLNKLGFNCIAIDQRSGKGVNGVENEAFREASKRGMGTAYPDAFPDLEGALKAALENYPSSKIFIWGSSYSASLVFVLARKYPDKIDAVIAGNISNLKGNR
jgi:pimeloyl-ACP methyl ester carboxylesterase